MKNHSVIFIDSSRYERLEKPGTEPFLKKASVYFNVNPCDLPKRIYTSFVPPIFSDEFRKVYVDFVGPLLAVSTLTLILQWGHSNKHPAAAIDTSPTLVLAYYSLLMPILCFLLARIGQSNLSAAQIISLLGYALYGHITTLITCYILDKETSNYVFFAVMTVFSGASGFRIVIILLMTIPKPAARLIVCSLVSIFHLLFLVFIHFAYMHQTFVYGRNNSYDNGFTYL
ncbi:mediator complex subunit 9 isoform X1 [Rhodnius prolixus]|uniref:Protein YIPF3 n=1 Tax=Rhodnius prolixus TaxID=13249 RepID=T1HRA6_RHOPR